MTASFLALSPAEFARSEFGGSALGDKRRTNRLVAIGQAAAAFPGHSICSLFQRAYDMNAAYDFFKQDYARPDSVQASHRGLARARCSLPGTYLLLEDTSDIAFPGREPVPGLGPIGNDKGTQGFHLHSVLAVRMPDQGLRSCHERHAPVAICGLLHQQFALRTPRTKRHERRDRAPGEKLETDYWQDAAAAIGRAPEAARWIYTADRGADIADHIQTIVRLGAGFTIRARHDRRLRNPLTGGEAGTLHPFLRSLPSLGTFTLHLRARQARPARDAVLHVSAAENILLQAPQKPGHGKRSGPPIRLNAVRVWEQSDDPGALEWLLLTSQPAGGFEQALEVALGYSCRWLVEEFHKALKSGMGAERLQLEEGSRLMAAIAVLSIVALRLLDLRDLARLAGERPAAEAGFDEKDLDLLGKLGAGRVETIRDAIRAIARLGGFHGRKCDGEPGMKVLWIGMRRFLDIKQGYLLANPPPGH